MVILTNHFKERFRQRIANTKRIEYFTEQAYCSGKTLGDIKSGPLAKMMKNNNSDSVNREAKIYANCIYWFADNVAITVYPIPQKMHHRV